MRELIQVAYSERGYVISSIMAPPEADDEASYRVKLEAQGFGTFPYAVEKIITLSPNSFKPVVWELEPSNLKDYSDYKIQIFDISSGSLIHEKGFRFNGELVFGQEECCYGCFPY